MDKTECLKIVLDNDYYTIRDLRHNQKLGFLFSKDKLEEFFKAKEMLIEEGEEAIKKLPLKTFNSKYCFYVNGLYIVNNYVQYLSTLIEDIELNKNSFLTRHLEDMLLSRIFSEVEGTLNVENVPTTHKRIREIFNNENLVDKNDVIIKNMFNAMDFIIKEKPAFNKDNLLKLYKLLSKNSLDVEDQLKEGAYYRHENVFVGAYEGADASIVEECMDSLFAFVNDPESIKKYSALLPHICHYYILYIHPYFDYNGRTARMVSFWLNYLFDISEGPLFMSEAINDNKKQYYEAIVNTRNTKNDLTYFLGYVLETAIKYSLLYKNLDEIKKYLSKSGDTLTSTEWGYLKKIIINNADGYFNYKTFLEYIHSTMTKAGALKVLNSFYDCGILEKSTNKKKEAIFKIKKGVLTYTIKNINEKLKI